MADREPTKLVQLKARMREPLRAQLEQAAESRGVSINAEMVDRLERSFRNQALLTEILTLTFGRELGGLVLAMAQVMEAAGRAPSVPPQDKFDPKDEQSVAAIYAHMNRPRGRKWIDNPQGYDNAVTAATALLDRLRPEGSPSEVTEEGEPERIAGALLDAIKGKSADSVDWPRDFTPEIVDLLAETPMAMRAKQSKRKGRKNG